MESVEDGTDTGDGALDFISPANTLTYTAPNDAAGTPVVVTAPGTYIVASTNGKRVAVRLWSVPGANASGTFPVSKAAVRTVGGGSIYRA